MTSRGVILAAGAGTRLTGNAAIRPKCLAPFGGDTLLDLQLRALRACGVDDITVVVGFEADQVRRASGRGVRFVENRHYADTNSLYSLWLARPLLTEGFVLLNCDVLFDPDMLADLLTARHSNAVLVSYPSEGDPPFGDEEMRVSVRRGRVTNMGKDLPDAATDAENVGIVKFSREGGARLIEVLDRIVSSGSRRDWAPRAFAEFARSEALFAVGTRGLPWTEIDTPEDYQRALRQVFPALSARFNELASPLRRGA